VPRDGGDGIIGTYGDAFRQGWMIGFAGAACERQGVKDDSEGFDGVPSSHDGRMRRSSARVREWPIQAVAVARCGE